MRRDAHVVRRNDTWRPVIGEHVRKERKDAVHVIRIESEPKFRMVASTTFDDCKASFRPTSTRFAGRSEPEVQRNNVART